jgi:hypothetical protein
MDLTPGTFMEWQRLQCKEFYDELCPPSPTNPSIVDENELETLFDCYTDLPDDFDDFFNAQTAEAV